MLENPEDKPLDRACLPDAEEKPDCSDVLEHMLNLSDTFVFSKRAYREVFGVCFTCGAKSCNHCDFCD
jgi:hypothetical protein